MKILKFLTVSAIAVAVLSNHGIALAQPASPTGTSSSRKAERRANHHLEREVRKQLGIAHVDAARVNVLAKSGAVSLLGTVKDEDQVALAGTATQSVPGVTSVRNELTVQDEGN